MTPLWRELWVEVDESEDLRYYRQRAEQLEWELEDLRDTVAKQQELLLQREQEIEELKQGRKQRRKRLHHGHGRRGRQPQADLKKATRRSSSDKKRRRPSKSPSSSSYSVLIWHRAHGWSSPLSQDGALAPSMGVPPPRTPVGPPPEHVRNDPSRQWPPPSTPSSPTNVTVRSMMPPCPTEQHRVAASPTAAAHGGGAHKWLHAVHL